MVVLIEPHDVGRLIDTPRELIDRTEQTFARIDAAGRQTVQQLQMRNLNPFFRVVVQPKRIVHRPECRSPFTPNRPLPLMQMTTERHESRHRR